MIGKKSGLMVCRASFFEEAMGEGAEARAGHEYFGVCLFGETDKERLTADGRSVSVIGKAVIDGDAAPGLAVIGGGEMTVETPNGARKMRVVSARRVRVDGRRVRHTVVELGEK